MLPSQRQQVLLQYQSYRNQFIAANVVKARQQHRQQQQLKQLSDDTAALTLRQMLADAESQRDAALQQQPAKLTEIAASSPRSRPSSPRSRPAARRLTRPQQCAATPRSRTRCSSMIGTWPTPTQLQRSGGRRPEPSSRSSTQRWWRSGRSWTKPGKRGRWPGRRRRGRWPGRRRRAHQPHPRQSARSASTAQRALCFSADTRLARSAPRRSTVTQRLP